MVYRIFTFLLVTVFTWLVYPAWAGTHEPTELKDTLRREAGPAVTADKEKTDSGQFFAYQLKDDRESGLVLLLHLKAAVDTLEILVFSPMGQSQRVMHKSALERGFYYLPLTQAAKGQPLYWEVRIDSSKALSFIR